MIKDIKLAAKENHGNAVLYGALIGLVISDIIPTPADAIYFSIEKKLRDKWKSGEITPRQYWTREALAYYGLNPLWWSLVALITISVKGDSKTKLKVALSLIGTTAVIGVILKNIKKDIKEHEKINPEEIIDMPEKSFKISELKSKLENDYNYTITPKIGNKK